ncbi:hypothetical protein [Prolixibacter sp. NT017]|uniref:hypothetical protein n=1 Tax=Prolixibacter sp. NT017 TaxID=2652390 RepID=UPI0012993C79|nr:hypothetical protein [Prolixibacter sp. NT017]
MIKKSIAVVFLILACCTTQRLTTTPNLQLIRVDNNRRQSHNYEAEVNFTRVRNKNYQFSVAIKNNSNNPVSVDPSLFSYIFWPGKNKISPQIYCVNPDETINRLERQKDSLMNEKNPYSLKGENTKEIVKNGLIQGTVAAIFGQDPKKWESQREEDEYNWEQDHSARLSRVEKELDFWNNRALLPQNVAPNTKISGEVLFPVAMSIKGLQISILLQNDTLNFGFKQSN